MRVWLINTSEPLPIDGENVRLRRVGILADHLAKQGNDVVWWTSTFDHWHKVQRFSQDTSLTLDNGCQMQVLHAEGYRKNISLGRLLNHRLVARKFMRLAEEEPTPNAILCSYPTLDTSVAAVKYGKRANVPVVLDIRDLWPDIFVELAPPHARGLTRLLLMPLFSQARRACSGAFAITGNSPAFVDFGLAYSGRERTDFDRDFPFGYKVCVPDSETRSQAAAFWDKLGVREGTGTPIICFFGSVGHQFDFATIIETARRIQPRCKTQFILCGKGDLLEKYRKETQDLPNVIFPGWIDASQIWVLMEMSQFALAPYNDGQNYEGNLTNKPIEYLAGGLPILTSLKQGALRNLLEEHACGVSYEGQPEKLVELICQLSDHRERHEKMVQNARKLFESRFVASKVYGEMVDYLERIAKEGHRIMPNNNRNRPCII